VSHSRYRSDVHPRSVEHWGVRDDMTLMRQLGVIRSEAVPAPA